MAGVCENTQYSSFYPNSTNLFTKGIFITVSLIRLLFI